jgi:uncharacterized protein with PQ loop repeat
MNITIILGLAGTVIGLVRALPQLVRLLRSRQALGVSVDTALTSAIVSFGWAAYGVLTNQPYVTLATGASAAVFFVITISALKFGRKIKEFRIAPVWFVALSVAFFSRKRRVLESSCPSVFWCPTSLRYVWQPGKKT